MNKKLRLLITVGVTTCSLISVAQNNADKPLAPPDAANTNAVTGTEVVPLITIDDAPLPDAIRTLARQANINFQFDNKILSGTPGPDGKIPPQPVVSIRWQNITAMDALSAVLDNNNLQLAQDNKTKIYRITAKDPAALEPLFTRVIPLRYSNPTNVVAMLQPTLSTRSKLLPDYRTGQLLVLATESEFTQMSNVLIKLDVSPNQILMEARFIETTKNPKTAKGIDWTRTLSEQNIKFGNNALPGIPGSPAQPAVVDPVTGTVTPGTPATGGTIGGILGNPGVLAQTAGKFFTPSVGYINADGLHVVLSFLNSDSDTETIATPRAVALEGVATELSVVRNVPVFEEQQGVNSGGSVSPNTVKPNYDLKVNGATLNEVGIKLIVTPRVFGGSNVFLDLKPEISDVEALPATATLSGRISTAPIFARRKLMTQAMIPSGNTLVLGGLVSDSNSKSRTKVPILGDLPGIGLAFRKDAKERSKRNLLIFVTPTIIAGEDFQPTDAGRDFLRNRTEEVPDYEWSIWDRAEPHDWTQPVY